MPRPASSAKPARQATLLAAGGTVFFLATLFVNLANFGFHAAVSRLLGTQGYGALGAVLAVLVVATVPLAGLQLACAQAQTRAAVDESARWILRSTAIGGAIAAVLAGACSSLLQQFFKLPSPAIMLWLAGWMLVASVGAAAQGTLMGRLNFRWIAFALVLGTGMGRLVLGVLLAELNFGPAGAMAATTIGQAITTALLIVPLLRDLHGAGDRRVRLAWQDGLLSTAALTGLALLTGIDTVLARHFYSGHASGIYSGAAIAGRIALFASGALALVAFPRFTNPRTTPQERRRILNQALVGVTALGLAAALILTVVPQLVVDVLLGSDYDESARLLRVLGIEGAALAVLTLLVYFQIARRSRLALVAWPTAVLVIAIAWIAQPGPLGLAWLMTGLVLVVTLLSLLLAHASGSVPRVVRMPHPATAIIDLDRPAALDLSLIVPFYNPGESLRPHVDRLINVLDATGVSFEIIPVADGCTDGSELTLADLDHDRVRPIVFTENHGKGHALRIGLATGRGRYLGFVDADGDLPADLLRAFVGVAVHAEPDLAIGSKRHPGSQVVYPVNRRMYSAGYQRLVQFLFGLSVRDTQTGLKIVRRDVAAAVLPRMLEKRYAFDLELLVVARRLGYKNVIELPVVIQRRITSTISFREVRRIIQDTLAIFYRLRILRWYDRDDEIVAVAPVPAVDPEVSVSSSLA